MTEAMACGTPVLANDTNGAKAQIKPNYNGFILNNNDDIQQFCVGNRVLVEQYLSRVDDEQYAKLSANAIESAQCYRMSEVIDKLLAIYHKV